MILAQANGWQVHGPQITTAGFGLGGMVVRKQLHMVTAMGIA